MSWKEYNDIIEAIMDADGLTLDEARERYSEMRDEGLDAADIADVYNVEPDYDSLDDWIDDYERGEFDEYDYDEFDGGVDTGGDD